MSTPFAVLQAPPGLSKHALLFHRIEHHEALNQVHASTLQCLSLDPGIDLHQVLGKRFSARIRHNLHDETVRHIDGIAAQARVLDQVGRYTRYEIELRPWLWFLSLTTDCRIFQDQTVPEILQTVFADHAVSRFEVKLTHSYAKRHYTVQYRQSDLDFVNWLCELEGITCHFRHDAQGHTLILTDSIARHTDCVGYEAVPFNAQVGRRRDDEQSMLDWQPLRSVASQQAVLTDYSFLSPKAPRSESRTEPGNLPQALGASVSEVFTSGQFHKESRDESESVHQAEVLLDSLTAPTRRYTGRSTARGLHTGGTFTLQRHAQREHNQSYLIIEHRVTAVFANYEGLDPTLLAQLASHDLPPLEGRLSGGTGAAQSAAQSPAQGAYFACEIDAQPASLAFRPARTTDRPALASTHTATVVGSGAGEIHTDLHGRIKVHFHWDRYGQRNGSDTCWLRVAQPWGGANWGAQFLPRVGQEVSVAFIEGDVEAPVVTGRLYNGLNRPAAFSRTGNLPGNQALAGFISKELGGGEYNQLLFDDTPEQLRTQAASTHAATQLNLGYEIAPRSDAATVDDTGAGAVAQPSAKPRGEGFEIRSDAWGAVRAAKGLVMSTDPQGATGGGHIDRQSLVGALEQALTLAKSLSKSANTAGAATGKDEQTVDEKASQGPDQTARDKQFKQIKGLGKGANNERDTKDAGLNHLTAFSPAGIAAATPKMLDIAAGSHIDAAAGKHVQLSSGQQTHVHAASGVRLFAQAGGIHTIANQGKVLIQSQHADTEINAEQSIQASASKKHILMEAQQHVTLVESGGAYLKIEGGKVEIGCPGTLTVKAASFALKGAASYDPQLEEFKKIPREPGKFSLRFAAEGSDELAKDAGWIGLPYKIVDEAGVVLKEGKVPADGRIPRVEADEMKMLTLSVGQPEWTEHVHVLTAQEDGGSEDAAAEDDPFFEQLTAEDQVFLTADDLEKLLQS
jgi:type VI secretion system secreted protein VgrG